MNNTQTNNAQTNVEPVNQNPTVPVDPTASQTIAPETPVESATPQAAESVANVQPQPQNVETNTQAPDDTFIDPAVAMQQQMQTIPTVDQSKEAFIDNTQANSTAKKQAKKDGPNWAFIIILFIIIFASIFFLFPYLLKTL